MNVAGEGILSQEKYDVVVKGVGIIPFYDYCRRMRDDVAKGVLVKPRAISVSVAEPQTFVQKLTFYNLNSCRIKYKVSLQVNGIRKYGLSRTRGSLGPRCCIDINLRYIPTDTDFETAVTDLVCFDFAVDSDAVTERFRYCGREITLVHIVPSKINVCNGYIESASGVSFAKPSRASANSHKTSRINKLSPLQTGTSRYIGFAFAGICAIVLTLPLKLRGNLESQSDDAAFCSANNSDNHVVPALLSGTTWLSVPCYYQNIAAYFLGIITVLVFMGFDR
ncbi:unnamed protein product [Enterobius vermicularis]|uniref:MSP domain-containing protein n=1 Tax=Enterobius vermicularis TaxID=51028 RepID=A0A0N4V252_ENTVE|nr:unnamed protein product [Enterobius vermicularis]